MSRVLEGLFDTPEWFTPFKARSQSPADVSLFTCAPSVPAVASPAVSPAVAPAAGDAPNVAVLDNSHIITSPIAEAQSAGDASPINLIIREYVGKNPIGGA